jgi:hypothetical protein
VFEQPVFFGDGVHISSSDRPPTGNQPPATDNAEQDIEQHALASLIRQHAGVHKRFDRTG